jgi:hypothetical protein
MPEISSACNEVLSRADDPDALAAWRRIDDNAARKLDR